MNHPFLPSALDPKQCSTCKYGFQAHTKGAHCEACSFVGECDIYPTVTSHNKMLLCKQCIQKELDANTAVLAQTQLSIIEKSREIDSSVKFNGDFFNAETVSLHALQTAVNSDASLTEPQRLARIQELTIERIEKFSRVLTKLQNKEHELVVQQQARLQFLRDFGNNLRQEIRERIKQSDSTYQPHKPPVPTKAVKPRSTTNPFDRIAQALAAASNITIEEARKRLEKGGIS